MSVTPFRLPSTQSLFVLYTTVMIMIMYAADDGTIFLAITIAPSRSYYVCQTLNKILSKPLHYHYHNCGI